MSLLLETVRCNNGLLENIVYHEQRLNRSRKTLFNSKNELSIMQYVPGNQVPERGLYKCRIIYAEHFMSYEFVPYTSKKINTIGIVESNSIEYSHKYVNRDCLQELLFHSGMDEIVIVKNGLITDTSYSNIVFVLEQPVAGDVLRYVTPRSPLLPGTQRQKLLDENKITERDVAVKDLVNFSGMILINSMLLLEESPIIHINTLKIDMLTRFE